MKSMSIVTPLLLVGLNLQPVMLPRDVKLDMSIDRVCQLLSEINAPAPTKLSDAVVTVFDNK